MRNAGLYSRTTACWGGGTLIRWLWNEVEVDVLGSTLPSPTSWRVRCWNSAQWLGGSWGGEQRGRLTMGVRLVRFIELESEKRGWTWSLPFKTHWSLCKSASECWIFRTNGGKKRIICRIHLVCFVPLVTLMKSVNWPMMSWPKCNNILIKCQN